MSMLFLFALIVAAAESHLESCPVTPKPSTCVTGLGYARFTNSSYLSQDGCCAACSAEKKCVAFEVRVAFNNTPAQCVLKSAKTHQQVNKGCVFSAFMPGAPSPSPPGPSPSPPGPSPVPPPSSLEFSDMFKGGAVLQRGKTISVWGKSSQKKVSLTLVSDANLTITGAVNSTGDWLIFVPAQTASWNRTLIVTDAIDTKRVVVSFGETILCVGQSNMGMQVGPSTRGFDADNATAESAASVRYTGKIFLHSRSSRWKAATGSGVDSTTWYSVDPVSIHNFSAVCWLTGRDLFEHLEEKVPVGLAMNAVGAHPIESWIGPDQLAACGITTNCATGSKAGAPNSHIWNTTILPMQPFTFGSMLWDQGEQDVNCHREGAYGCMLAGLASSYREQFNSSFPLLVVQLPGYSSQHEIFPMRIVQDRAARAIADAAVVATYDDSCAEDQEHGCPHGNVHNVHKQPVGARLALKIRAMTLGEQVVSEGPRAMSASVEAGGVVRVAFQGGTPPFYFADTRNCTVCCAGSDTSDFDMSVSGPNATLFANGTLATITKDSAGEATVVQFKVDMASPRWLRYTANRIYPQCALYNQEGLPALPFEMAIGN